MITIALLVVLASLLGFLIYWANEANQELKRRGVKHRKPVLFFGNLFSQSGKQRHYSKFFEEVCKEFPDEPIVGFYGFTQPWLIVRDADYVEKILIKDFTHFTDRSFQINEEKNPIDAQLFLMNGKRWRAFRYKLSPVFTVGKLKSMFESMIDCGDDLEQHLKKSTKKDIDFKSIMSYYTMDVLGSSVFGIHPKALQNPNSEYCRLASDLFVFGFWHTVNLAVMAFFPKISKMLGLSFNKPEPVKYFSKIITDTFEYRKKNNIHRNDFAQLLLALKEKKTIDVPNWDPNDEHLKGEEPSNHEAYEIDDNVLMAQAYSFLVNGVDGLSMSETYVLLELARNPEIQEKTRMEIQEQISLHKGLSYEALKNMTYLEKVIKESMRFHPIIADLTRICNKQYTFPNGFTMKKGDEIRIPIMVIHKDPNYFPDPECFKPERFDVPMKPGTYLPFGDGPRVCIAMRYANVLIKLSMAKILTNFRVKLSSKTKLPFEIKPVASVVMPQDPLLFDLEEINQM